MNAGSLEWLNGCTTLNRTEYTVMMYFSFIYYICFNITIIFGPQAGFFKSKFKEMINDNAADPEDDGDAVTTD